MSFAPVPSAAALGSAAASSTDSSVDAVARERAKKPIDEPVEDALDRRVVRALAEHRADGLDEIALDADRLLAAAFGDVIEAARDAVDADRVHADRPSSTSFA